MRYLFIVFALLVVECLSGRLAMAQQEVPRLPNILWLTSEDHGPHMGCYGDRLARTPHVDQLAEKGMRYRMAWSVVPVCAPARTAIITGVYPSASGALHMRSMVPWPEEQLLFPAYLRKAGYYTTNNSKEDYNVPKAVPPWDKSGANAHWRNRKSGQPFFAVFNSTKSHESQIRKRPHQAVTNPADVRIPKYHPDTPEVRQDWAQYYDQVSAADADAGVHLQELAEAGLAEETIVFYFADHGSGMPRNKRWAGNTGLQVPFVVYFPEKYRHLAPADYRAGGVSDRLISFVDLAPTVLSLANIQPPAYMQGHAFAGPYAAPAPQYMFGVRGRMDERPDHVRSVTDGRYVYLRNYLLHLPHGQYLEYQFQTPTTVVWKTLFDQGKLNPAQSAMWVTPREPEELYDLSSDPDEVVNLALDPAHAETIARFRKVLFDQNVRVRDVCYLPEDEMHRRSKSTTPWGLGHSPETFALEKTIEAADVAASKAAKIEELSKFLSDPEPGVRYWGLIGLLIRQQRDEPIPLQAVLLLMKDESPSVQIVAAQLAVLAGSSAEQAQGLALLKTLATPEKSDVLTSISALTAIESLGDRGQSLWDDLLLMNTTNLKLPDQRFSPYIPRLLLNLKELKERRSSRP